MVDALAVTIEVIRAAGVQATPEPKSSDTGNPPIVIVQDTSPSPVANGPEGAGVVTTIAISAVARSRAACTEAADQAVAALIHGAGRYGHGRLVRARSTMLPRFVQQNVLAVDDAWQRNAMVRIVARP